ncbi:hypothetical protein [Halalkalibaculum sp. DA384]|uniref:hypothetical protein n=1 Tax=Halalkalibaculum sp. DA384 TaxID=3373606 RepID=UPI003754EA57
MSKKIKIKRTSGNKSKESENLDKFLAPNSSEWKLLELPKDEQEDKEKQKEVESNSESIKETLLSSLQMPHLAVLAGSGTSLGEVGGPSMGDLWEKVTNNNPTYRYKDNGEEKEIEINPEEIIEVVKHDSRDKNIEALLTQCEAYLRIEEEKVV